MIRLFVVGFFIIASLTASAQGGNSTSEQVLSQRLLQEISSGLQWQIRAVNAEAEVERYKKDKECEINKEVEKQKKEAEKKEKK